MLSKVFKAQLRKPLKGDWVEIVTKRNHENQVRIDDYVRRGSVHDSENQVAIDDDVKRGRG